MKKVFFALAGTVAVVLVGGILVWYFFLYQKTDTDTTSTKPTPGVGFGNLNPYAKLCKEFQNTNSKISCEEAVSLALEKAQGEVQKVSIGPIQRIDRDSSPPKLISVDNWLIDIKLQQAYFDKALKKDVKTIRIGIDLHQHLGFYKQVLE